ncbi:hypothetical protein BD311DRAFT_750662 [Dichomitus squalens]|uniref:Uncharacterized protein n=1 Tax=Dichomitus squalens TaxID=114155 RepID=A0A4Q9MW35_9APHY|nr:hypothetical protein BD311DRAFT_750662 [Dichomitus squalens]
MSACTCHRFCIVPRMVQRQSQTLRSPSPLQMKQWLLLFQAIPRVARQQGPCAGDARRQVAVNFNVSEYARWRAAEAREAACTNKSGLRNVRQTLSLHVGTYPGFRYTRTTCAERYPLCAMKLARAIKGAGQPEIALVPTAPELDEETVQPCCCRRRS